MGGIARREKFSVTIYNKEKAFPGYTYFAPFWEQSRAYLIDMEGRFVNYWQMPGRAAEITYMLENGHIIYPYKIIKEDSPKFPGFCGAEIQEVDWDGNVVWKHWDSFQHHTTQRLKNGNTIFLFIVETPPEIAKEIVGGKPGTEDKGKTIWTCGLREVNPKGESVWEWLAYEHLDLKEDTICPMEHRDEWTHGNSIEEFDNGDILTCLRYPSLVMRINKQTKETVWKWGSGEVYHPHNPTILENGNILVFDNGPHRPDAYLAYSRCVEFDPKTGKVVWEYVADPPTEFFSSVCAGCQRLPNGNTLVMESTKGRIFEITMEGEVVWEYYVPFFTPLTSGQGTFNLGRNPFTHRAYRYPLDMAGFKDKDLNPDRFKALNDIYGPEAFNF